MPRFGFLSLGSSKVARESHATSSAPSPAPSRATSPYDDCPLQPGRQDIRLVSILLGKWADDVKCQLNTISLSNSHPRYEALSYVWGTEGHIPILLNGRPHKASRNLYLALRRLRKAKDIRTIWIDALCINQNDTVEKGHQVALMGYIYKQASRVYLWLGDYTNTPNTFRDTQSIEEAFKTPARGKGKASSSQFDKGYGAFQLIHELARGNHLYDLSCYRRNGAEIVMYDHGVLDAFWSLMSQPWWSRIWVVQETLLPPEVIVVYGSIFAPWKKFATAAEVVAQHYSTCCSISLRSLSPQHLRGFEQFYTGVLQLEQIRENHLAKGPMLPFHQLLQQFRLREATDPRDMVHALFGFARDINAQLGFAPDYSLTKRDVYEKITVLSMKHEGKLGILRGQRTPNPHMPSWVYDWSSPMEPAKWVSELGRFQTSPYKAAREEKIATCHLEDSSLSLDGIYVDRVAAVGSLVDNSSPTTYDRIALTVVEWSKMFFKNWEPVDYNQPYIGGRSLKNAFWRTITMDVVIADGNQLQLRRAVPGLDSIFEDWWNKVTAYQFDNLAEPKPTWLSSKQVAASTSGQAFFVTQNGYMQGGF